MYQMRSEIHFSGKMMYETYPQGYDMIHPIRNILNILLNLLTVEVQGPLFSHRSGLSDTVHIAGTSPGKLGLIRRPEWIVPEEDRVHRESGAREAS